MENKIRFAMLGCGRIANAHFNALIEHKDRCILTAVCDNEPEKAQEAADKYGATSFSDYDQMLKAGGFDAVIITTPSGLHSSQTVKAAEHGYHVITEKPIALTLDSADAMIDACDKAGKHLFVVKQNRLTTSMQRLYNAMDLGRFGKLYFAQVNVFWARPQEYYDVAPWRGTWEHDGGAFMNQASHYIDLMCWLMGDADYVQAVTETLGRKIETEDTGSAVIKFKNGSIGSINVTMLTYPKNMEGSITILGEKGTVKIGGKALTKIEQWQFADYHDDDKLIEDTQGQLPDMALSGHGNYYKNVLDVLSGSAEKPEIDGLSGRKAIELILAINKASREGKSVSLPLNGD